jgi:hypothetical protein
MKGEFLNRRREPFTPQGVVFREKEDPYALDHRYNSFGHVAFRNGVRLHSEWINSHPSRVGDRCRPNTRDTRPKARQLALKN